MKAVFWNTNKNTSINQYIVSLVKEREVDLIVLAEYEADSKELLNSINESGRFFNKFFTEGTNKIVILGEGMITCPYEQDNNFSIQLINQSIILCAVHLPSRLYYNSEENRRVIARRIVEKLIHIEKDAKTNKTIILGDINSNPYDKTCIYKDCFCALPSAKDSQRKMSKYAGQNFWMFYNPMWNLLGDFNGVPGTYYYSGSGIDNTYWYMLDQVMIRPELVDLFIKDSLEIITDISGKSILTHKGIPKKEISDHLPLFFEIKEEY